MPSITYSAAKAPPPRTLSGPSSRNTCAPMSPCWARAKGSNRWPVSSLRGPSRRRVGVLRAHEQAPSVSCMRTAASVRRASSTLNALPASGRASASSASAASRNAVASPLSAERLLGAPRSPRFGSDPAQGQTRAEDRVAVELDRSGDRDQRERVAGTITDLAIGRGSAGLGAGSSTAVISSPGSSTVSISGRPREAVQVAKIDRASAAALRMWTTASSAASATHISEGWVATHAGDAPRIA